MLVSTKKTDALTNCRLNNIFSNEADSCLNQYKGLRGANCLKVYIKKRQLDMLSLLSFLSVWFCLHLHDVIIQPKECRDTSADGYDYTALHILFHTNTARDVRSVCSSNSSPFC